MMSKIVVFLFVSLGVFSGCKPSNQDADLKTASSLPEPESPNDTSSLKTDSELDFNNLIAASDSGIFTREVKLLFGMSLCEEVALNSFAGDSCRSFVKKNAPTLDFIRLVKSVCEGQNRTLSRERSVSCYNRARALLSELKSSRG